VIIAREYFWKEKDAERKLLTEDYEITKEIHNLRQLSA